MPREDRDWFWKEIVHIDLTRGFRYALVLLIIDAALLFGDLVRSTRGTMERIPGYHSLFLAHVTLFAILVIFLVVTYTIRPESAESITSVHAVLAIGFAAVFLFFCTASAMIVLPINGQITIYVIGALLLAVAMYLPLQVSVPLYLINHAAFIVSLTALHPVQTSLTSHYVNGSIVMIMAVVIAKLSFDGQRRIFQGMSIIQSQQSELERLAIEDSLTGLFNRRYADARLAEEYERARRYRRSFSVAIADIDHFKLVNDTFSHLVGDEVLRQLADLLRAEIRAVDVVARYGGEEFVLIFPETTEETAYGVCEKIRWAVERHNWHVVADGLTVTVSIGVAGGNSADNLRGVIAVADGRLYEAKQTGRNRVQSGHEGSSAKEQP